MVLSKPEDVDEEPVDDGAGASEAVTVEEVTAEDVTVETGAFGEMTVQEFAEMFAAFLEDQEAFGVASFERVDRLEARVEEVENAVAELQAGFEALASEETNRVVGYEYDLREDA